MTKQVRIENADTSNWIDQPGAVQIDRPTQMCETYLTSHRRLVIEERPADPPAQA